ncbi:MAG: hypothetical protein HC882_09385 [Acidobacteria bacterium]|nr:hypothetical protein [Acidobacteriota bacterium]
MGNLTHLAAQNAALLRQGASLIEGLDDGHFAGPGSEGPGGGVGSQLRHVLDYYGCFLRDVGAGRVDYDRRERDPRLEQERVRAITRMLDWATAMERVGDAYHDGPLDVRMESANAPAGADSWSRSSLGRELHFLASHTVHHFALVSVMLRARGVIVPTEIGVAPSTLEHWNRQGRCAR